MGAASDVGVDGERLRGGSRDLAGKMMAGGGPEVGEGCG